MRKVLSVGGNSKEIPLPRVYDGWERFILDIDPGCQPDILCDARDMLGLPADEYDAIYCSHNLEHHYHHVLPKVLAGFRHVLKPDGFAHILVPDVGAVIQTVVEKNLDIGDVLGITTAGPVTVRDVFYGYGVELERSGNDFFAHRSGFTKKSMLEALRASGFPYVILDTLRPWEITACAFTEPPTPFATKLLGIGPRS